LAQIESIFIGEDPEREFLLSTVLSELIEQSRIAQVRGFPNFPNSPANFNWIEDFCTINLRGNRGIGHTKSMIDVIIEKRLNSLVYLSSWPMYASVKQFLFNRLLEEGFDYRQPVSSHVEATSLDVDESFFVHFCKVEEEMSPIHGLRNVDAVFLDPYSELSKDPRKLAEIKRLSYAYANLGSDFFFIGVG